MSLLPGKIAILKMGALRKSVSQDYDKLLIAGLQLPSDNFTVYDVPGGAVLPTDLSLAGIIISGAAKMITAGYDWLEPTCRWLRRAADRHIPMLGICFGHQLLAVAFGGKVAANPRGIEVGTKKIFCSRYAEFDRLLNSSYPSFKAQVSHVESVLKLPENTVVLAYSEQEPNQAFRIGKNIWGLQFHPEFDAGIIRKLIVSKAEKYPGRIDVEKLLAEVKETSQSYAILKRFGEIIAQP